MLRKESTGGTAGDRYVNEVPSCRTQATEREGEVAGGVRVLVAAAVFDAVPYVQPPRKAGLVRALIISDVHGNLAALRSVIAEGGSNGGFDQIWSLGDIVGYGPDPGACIDLIRQYDHIGVAGNHDLAAVGGIGLESFNTLAADALRWTTTQLDDDQLSYLRHLPLRLETDGFTLAHGSPRDPVWEYLVSPSSAAANFDYFTTPVCLVGHSHFPFVCKPKDGSGVFYIFPLRLPVTLKEERAIINPGSVGQPRDGVPTASCALYDSDAAAITHLRAAYDIKATQERMRSFHLPEYLATRLEMGR